MNDPETGPGTGRIFVVILTCLFGILIQRPMQYNPEDPLKELSGPGKRVPSRGRVLMVMGSCRLQVAEHDPQPDALMEGFTSVATVTAGAGYHVEICDARKGHDPAYIMERAAAADAVMFPLYLSQLGFFRELCSALKARFPKKPIIMGGPLPSAVPAEALDFMRVDHAVIGEGERSVTALLDAVLERGGPGLADIGGIAYRENGVVKINPPGKVPEPLDALPFPDYSLWKDRDAFTTPFSVGISSVRGCGGRCGFCSRIVSGPRFKSLGRFEAELVHLKDRYGVTAVTLNDPHLKRGPEGTSELCGIFGKHDIRYFCFLRVLDVTPALAARLKETGCYGVYVGIESYNEDILRGINKHNGSLAQMDAAIGTLSRAGLKVVCGIIFGLPGETEATLKNTLKFIEKHKILPDVHYLTLDPGSPMYDRLSAKGGLKDPLEYLLGMETDQTDFIRKTCGLVGVDADAVMEYLGKVWAIKEERLRNYHRSLDPGRGGSVI